MIIRLLQRIQNANAFIGATVTAFTIHYLWEVLSPVSGFAIGILCGVIFGILLNKFVGLLRRHLQTYNERREVESTPEQHRERHILLHKHLYELAADFISQTTRLASRTILTEFMLWASKQATEPDHESRLEDVTHNNTERSSNAQETETAV